MSSIEHSIVQVELVIESIVESVIEPVTEMFATSTKIAIEHIVAIEPITVMLTMYGELITVEQVVDTECVAETVIMSDEYSIEHVSAFETNQPEGQNETHVAQNFTFEEAKSES